MFKKTITYTDYDGNPRTEDCYFNLSKAEMLEMGLFTGGAMTAKMEKAVDEGDQPALMQFVKELIEKSYGIKSDDGRRFVKSKEQTDEFMQTEAYSELYVQLMTDYKSTVKFMSGLMPGDVSAQAMAALENLGDVENMTTDEIKAKLENITAVSGGIPAAL